ncbi:MAG: DNA primase [Chloroflexi bacterium]|nr:DNA primase [Chloroflexota bacterium]
MSLTDDVKQRLDIVDVVSQYVPSLQKAGRNYKALCPFHTEKTPSFVVFPDRQSWRCFGACATGGDIFTFVMQREQAGFSDTLKQLAQRAGVSVPERQVREEHQALFQVNEAAATFFQELLHSPRGASAREYLEQRGVDREATDRFQLGLSPVAGDELLKHLTALGSSDAQAVDAGLAVGGDEGPVRGRFRGRLMIPIRDDRGNLVGFGGRSLDGSDPKYLNSPRTPVFDKGRILYAFHLARQSIKKTGEGVVVEGYMDAIAAHRHGFDNVVASMGTAVTEAQVRLLVAVGQRFVLALDPDAAGQEATRRSLQSSWRVLEQRVMSSRRRVTLYERPSEVSLRIAVLPPGDDPDAVIRENPDQWERFIREAPPLPDYLLTRAPDWWDLSTSEGKTQATEQLYPFYKNMADQFERERYIRRLADLLSTTPETLAVSAARPQRPSSRRREPAAAPQTSSAPFEQEHRDPLEEHLLSLILRWPDLKETARSLPPDAFRRPDYREVFILWQKCSTIEELYQTADEEIREQVESMLSAPFPPTDVHQREEAVRQCLYRMEERHLRELKAEEALLLAQTASVAAQDEGESQGVDALEQRVVDTNERLRQLFGTSTQIQRRE